MVIKKYKILFIMLSLILIAIIISIYFFISNISRVEQNNQTEKYDCDLEIICNKHEIKPGQVLICDINVKNIQAKNGVIMFETLIDYDKEVFEMEVTNDEQNNSWNKTSIIDNYLTTTIADAGIEYSNGAIYYFMTANNTIPQETEVKAKPSIPVVGSVTKSEDTKDSKPVFDPNQILHKLMDNLL